MASPKPVVYGSLAELVKQASEPTIMGLDSPSSLPGVTLESYTLHTDKELFGSAEVYMFGVAVDASEDEDGKYRIRVIPFGEEELSKASDALRIEKVSEGETVKYLGRGMLLVAPPTKGFLAMRLMLADSDSSIRDAVGVVEKVAETVASKEAVGLLTATGMPQAAAVAFLLGKALEAGAAAMKNNNDDLIEAFEGYFTRADMPLDDSVTVEQAGATIRLQFVEVEAG